MSGLEVCILCVHMCVVQMYYTARANSPVYSVAFNSRQLFSALDLGVHCLNFSLWCDQLLNVAVVAFTDRPNATSEHVLMPREVNILLEINQGQLTVLCFYTVW